MMIWSIMNMKKIFKKVVSSGIWLQPLILIVICGVIRWKGWFDWLDDKNNWYLIIAISFLPIMYMWLDDLGKPSESKAFSGKEKYKYPKIDKELLNNEPDGVLFGKDINTDKYVRKATQEPDHVFVLGGSGSGKSSTCVIPTILKNSKDATIFAIDIKGELSFKATKYLDENVCLFNPQDRHSYGYNPFYMLNEHSNNQDILECMQNIAFSLIPMPANLSDPFWKNSARNLLIGFLIYFYNQGHTNFISIIDEILSQPIKETIEKIIENVRPTSAEYRYIIQFKDMADETLGGIQSEVINHIIIFANDNDVRYALRDNPSKISPLLLEQNKSIFVVIKEEKLTAYYDLLQLVINQTLAQLEKRAEDSKPIYFIIDELPRLLSAGKIDRLLDAGRTLRSREVKMILISQSVDAIMSAYSENEANDLISNCAYILVLSATTSKTQKQIIDWCGKYKEQKMSWNGEGKNRKASVSFNEHDMVDGSDLVTLVGSGDAILISPYGYNRIKKVPYYTDKHLAPLSKECVDSNKKYLKERKTS